MYIKTQTRNLPKKNSLRKHHLQSFSEWFPLKSLWLSIARLVKLLPQHLIKSYKKKNPESLKYVTLKLSKTPTVLFKIPIASDGEYCINFSKYMGGGGCVAPRTPPTRGKKNSSRIIPCISGETPASHTLHNGAFVTINVKIKKKTKKNQHQSARNGLRMHLFASVFPKKLKPQPGKTPPPPFFFERLKDENTTASRISSVAKLEKILTSNRQKGLIRHHLHPFFKNFLGETLTSPPLLREDKSLPSWALYGVKFTLKSAKKLAQNAPFASIFLKFFRVRPWTPTTGRGYPLLHLYS